MSGETVALTLLTIAEWATYLGVLGFIGAYVARRVVVRPALASVAPEPALCHDVDRRLRQAAIASVALTLLAVLFRLYAQTYSVFGLDEPVTLELMRVVGIDSRWGRWWRPQAMAAVGGLLAVVWVAVRPSSGWTVAAVGVLALAVTLPLTGHALAYAPHALSWGLQILHLLAAGAWIGTLATLVWIILALRGRPDAPDPWVAALIERFSPLAILAVSTAIATGGITAVLYVGSLANLTGTLYGRVLLGKTVLVLATGAVGAYNWRRLKPILGTGASTALLLRSGGIELLLAVLLLGVTGLLVHLPMPAELGN